MRLRPSAAFTAIGVLLGAALGVILWRGIPQPAEPAPTPEAGITPVTAPLVGARAPEFSAPSVDGETYRLSEQQGRPVILNFWATWCEPCRAEMPLLEARARELADAGLLIVGVNFDEPEAVVREYRDDLGLTLPLLLDPGGKIQRLYRVVAYPTTFFVGRDGLIRAVHLGVLDENILDEYLAALGLG